MNLIYNEDCLETMRRMDNESVDLIVTDPPYLMSYKTNHRKNKNHKFCNEILNDNNEDLIINYISECHRVLKNNSAMYMFCNSNKVNFFKNELEKKFKVKNIIVWVKNNHTAGDLQAGFGKQYEFIILVNKGRKKINGKRLTDVWSFNRVVGNNQSHQNEKPLDLIKLCIEKHSNKNDLIFDGFMGSGTTAKACIDLNRNFIGSELDKEYYEICMNKIKGK